MSDVQAPFDPQEVVFTALAHWIAERDGITPDQAAINLGALLGSDEVAAQVAADKAKENAPVIAAQTAAQEAVAKITQVLADLKAALEL